MRVQYRHQVPGPVQYGVKEAILEDDVAPDQIEATLRRMAEAAEAAVPWPGQHDRRPGPARAPAPAEDPKQAAPRPSRTQLNALREAAAKAGREIAPPATAAEADALLWALKQPALARSVPQVMTPDEIPRYNAPEPHIHPSDLVPDDELDKDAWDPKLRQWFEDAANDIEAVTQQPVMVRPPRDDNELRDLCKHLSDERKKLGVKPRGARWSGHDNPNYPPGSSLALKDRRCSYEHCDGRQANLGRMIESNVWDYSIRNHGRPLCRPCQGVAPRV